MKPNELRIGNWVRYYDDSNEDFVVSKIEESEEMWFVNGTWIDDVVPIPLTPKILEKAGFYWSIYHQAYHFGDAAMMEFYDLNECHPKGFQLSTFKKGTLIGGSILYLHQLQNIYYALTGEELEIKL